MESTKNQEVITPEPSASTGNKKEGNGLKIATIICAILALAGIGFGIYGMMKKPVETPTEDNAAELEAELSNVKQKYAVLQNYVKELEASGTEVPEEAKSATDISTTTLVKDIDEYIYLGGDFNAKIKKPDSDIHGAVQDKSIPGSSLSYAFDNHRLYVWATVYRTGDQAAGAGAFYGSKGEIGSPFLAEISSVYGEQCLEGEKIGVLNGKTLCYIETDNETLKNAHGDGNMERYIEPTLEILRKHFINMDNYVSL